MMVNRFIVSKGHYLYIIINLTYGLGYSAGAVRKALIQQLFCVFLALRKST